MILGNYRPNISHLSFIILNLFRYNNYTKVLILINKDLQRKNYNDMVFIEIITMTYKVHGIDIFFYYKKSQSEK